MDRHISSIYNLKFLTCAISLAGILSLSLGGMLPWPVFALLALLHVAEWRWFFHRDIPGYLFGLCGMLVFAGELGRIFMTGREAILPAMRDLIVILAMMRLVLRKTNREIYQIIGISLAESLLATVFTISPAFLIGIALQVLLIPMALSFLDMLEFHGEPWRLPRMPHWFIIFSGMLLISALLFFVLPRPSSTLLKTGLAQQHRTGFSDQIKLERAGVLEEDNSIVMRAIWNGQQVPRRFYLAGARLEKLTAQGFEKRSEPERYPRPESRFSDSLTIYPTGLEARNVFFPFSFAGTRPDTIVANGANIYWRRRTPAFYEVFINRAPESVKLAAEETFPAELEEARPLTLRIAPQGSSAQRAERIEAYLESTCVYSLNIQQPRPGVSPIISFMQGGSGVCEHFATAMAVMLRAIDIPARVVTGFLVSEYNTGGNYFIVRARDAHAWVEYDDNGVWVSADPTPQAASPSAARVNIFDTLRFRWIRWVIEYSLQDQINIAISLRTNTRKFSSPSLKPGKWITGFVALGGISLFIYLLMRLRKRRRIAYVRVLNAISRKGLRLNADDPHEAHLAEVQKLWPELADDFARYQSRYLAWRFGGEKTDIRALNTVMLSRIKSAPTRPENSSKRT